jgi:hypothetical protein
VLDASRFREVNALIDAFFEVCGNGQSTPRVRQFGGIRICEEWQIASHIRDPFPSTVGEQVCGDLGHRLLHVLGWSRWLYGTELPRIPPVPLGRYLAG